VHGATISKGYMTVLAQNGKLQGKTSLPSSKNVKDYVPLLPEP
jgi:hypothetical protein